MTAYEMRSSDWSSDVCASDLGDRGFASGARLGAPWQHRVVVAVAARELAEREIFGNGDLAVLDRRFLQRQVNDSTAAIACATQQRHQARDIGVEAAGVLRNLDAGVERFARAIAGALHQPR